MSDTIGHLPGNLRDERGMPGSGVAIWRPDSSADVMWKGTVGEFLSDPANQSGRWLIDGGWGGPPGALAVDWNGYEWRSMGFPPHAPYQLHAAKRDQPPGDDHP